ncbi:MAG: hypothetical protein QOG96_1264, partial [Pseudonocardiales bacterium]|nr:hypothetical protein [Pseudonocardiales bacterium]
AVPRVFDAISPRDIQLWGKHTVKLRHNLAEREDLFSDESLANLVETIDLKRIDITTMDDDPAIWGHVDRAGQPGAKVLDAVRGGRVWINLMAIEKADPRFADLLAQMYDELETIMPDFKTFKRKLGLLISSPTARVYYHFDVPGQGLWQIRGRKRIWIYPPTEPFLQPTRIENVVRSLTTEELDYQPWFDDYAEVHDLGPGDMLHWSLNGPHRVSNLDGFSVSLTTEHWTSQIRRSYAMHYGNGILRNKAHWAPRSNSLDGPAFWTKAALTAAWRKTGMEKKNTYNRVLSYKVDPDAPLGVVPLAEKDRTTVLL